MTSEKELPMSASPHFTPETSALVLIDHQVGTLQPIRNITPDTIIRNAVLLGKAALAYKMPIVLTSSQEDHIQGPLHPALQQALPDAYAARVKRVGIVNAWTDPHFVKAIEKTGRRKLIMAAVTTDICLVFPAVSAVEAGYVVLAVMDACGTDTEIGEEMSRRRMERAGVWLTSTNTMVAELVQDWSTPQGMVLVQAMTAVSPMLPVEWAQA
jgi:nicotinamidase-related amidase